MMRGRSSSFNWKAGVLLSLLFVGCQENQQATVTGSVTLDGKALDHGTVIFVASNNNDSQAAAGGIQSDGTYRVQIGQSGNLWSGEYAVEVTATKPSVPHPQGGPPTPGLLITPERYSNASTSGLRYNIRSGENTIDIVLASAPPNAKDKPAAVEEQAEAQVLEGEKTVEKSFSKETVKDAGETVVEVESQNTETTIEESSGENAKAPAE